MAMTALLCAAPVKAQESAYTPVPVCISKEKVRMGDRLYYSHVVQERQTLYSISKAYNVSVEEIYEANPELELEKNGLKKNSILRIPIHDAKEEARAAEKETRAAGKEARTARNSGQDGDKVRNAAQVQTIHTVKWYEDLAAIAKKYGVSEEDIIKANKLSDSKLKSRMKLVIPAAGEVEDTEAAAGEEAVTEAPAEQTEECVTVPEEETAPAEEIPERKEELNFALILPLKAAGGFADANYMDFYSGALLASHDAAAEGVRIEWSVYDDAAGAPALTRERLSSFDAVIGPVGKNNMAALLERADDGCTLVSPLDSRTGALTETYPAMCQANTETHEQYRDLASWMAEDLGADDHVLLIYEKSKTSLRNMMDTLLRSSGISFTELSYNILEGRSIGESIKARMTPSAGNRVVIASESEAFVNDVIRNLNVAVHDGYEIILYGPSRFKSFETIDIENLHNVNMHISMSYNIDYEKPEVKSFVMKYRALFGTEPSTFAFRGYDITSYFAKACSAYGNGWRSEMEGKRVELLQNDIRFERLPGRRGYTNTALRRVIYGPDCSVLNLK